MNNLEQDPRIDKYRSGDDMELLRTKREENIVYLLYHTKIFLSE